ncbi:hypothetical protein [Litorimonas sp.]|uniref:hypothetical protein n=1 Tax=Litorimonas sp. TaxID=1892381 RepID=UPI003A8B9825
MRSIKFITLMGVTAAMLSCPAFATDQNVNFRGIINNSCTLVVLNDGLLGVSSDQTVLSSKESGGLQGRISAVTNGPGNTIEIISPSGFTVGPPSADVNTIFETEYSASGGTILSNLLGVVVSILGIGTTTIDIDATATKTSGTFESGAYELTTVVRCVVP